MARSGRLARYGKAAVMGGATSTGNSIRWTEKALQPNIGRRGLIGRASMQKRAGSATFTRGLGPRIRWRPSAPDGLRRRSESTLRTIHSLIHRSYKLGIDAGDTRTHTDGWRSYANLD
jgi:hypothetical protein